jgi:hypothetical protein
MRNKETYDERISKDADYLCGFSCGWAVDIIIDYCKRPDLSEYHLKRLIDELIKLQNKLL